MVAWWELCAFDWWLALLSRCLNHGANIITWIISGEFFLVIFTFKKLPDTKFFSELVICIFEKFQIIRVSVFLIKKKKKKSNRRKKRTITSYSSDLFFSPLPHATVLMLLIDLADPAQRTAHGLDRVVLASSSSETAHVLDRAADPGRSARWSGHCGRYPRRK